jgi:rRNA-processing protein FCF1
LCEYIRSGGVVVPRCVLLELYNLADRAQDRLSIPSNEELKQEAREHHDGKRSSRRSTINST